MAAIVALAVGGWTSSAVAVLQVYEGFQYVDGSNILKQIERV
jgi:hypothetical protein